MPKMRCELRDHEADHLAILPIPQPDGSLNTMACLEHAMETEYFCRTHDYPHLGFDDDSHACTRCIDEKTAHAGLTVGLWYWNALKSQLDEDEFEIILAELSEVPLSPIERPAMILLHWIMTAAERLKLTDEKVVQEVIDSGSVGLILPPIPGMTEKR